MTFCDRMATTSLQVLIASILAKPEIDQRRVGALVKISHFNVLIWQICTRTIENYSNVEELLFQRKVSYEYFAVV